MGIYVPTVSGVGYVDLKSIRVDKSDSRILVRQGTVVVVC